MNIHELSDTEALVATTVLEDALLKLGVMKYILPTMTNQTERRSTLNLEPRFMKLRGPKDKKKDEISVGSQRDEETGEAKHSDDVEDLDAYMPEISDLPSNDLEKAQKDRYFLAEVLRGVFDEINERRTFESLRSRIRQESAAKNALQRILEREATSTTRITGLNDALKKIKITRVKEVGKRKKKLAYMKNELQELKAKLRMEDAFLMKTTLCDLDWKKLRWQYDEQNLRKAIRDLEDAMEEETRSNVEMESIIGIHQAELDQRVEMWSEKYDRDFDAKTKEVETLKKMMAADKERLEMLTVLYAEYEEVIVDDRIMREKERRRLEKERRENEATIRIQSWWRGVIIRKGLRPCKPPKKKKKKKK